VIALALAIAASQAQAAGPDAEACAILQALVGRETAPQRIDAVTQSAGASLSCPQKTLTFNKVVSVNLSDAPAGWRQNGRRDWSNFVCNGAGFGPMARRGWTFIESWTFRNGERVTIVAQC
jgi:hypothetical protein